MDLTGDNRYMQEPLYIKKLKDIAETEEYTLDVDCDHLIYPSEENTTIYNSDINFFAGSNEENLAL